MFPEALPWVQRPEPGEYPPLRDRYQSAIVAAYLTGRRSRSFGSIPLQFSVGTEPTYRVGARGTEAYFDAVLSQYLQASVSIPVGTQFSVIVGHTPGFVNVGYARLADTDFASAWYLGSNTSGGQYAWIVNNSSLEGCIGGSQTVGVRDLVIGTFRAGTRSLYVNGRLVASAAATAPTAALKTLTIGRQSGSSSGYWVGSVDSLIVLPFAMSAAMVADYAADELSIFEPRRFFVPAVAAAGSFSATGALTAGAATLSGTAAHLTLHPSSGALSAQAATLAGTATHLTLHTSSGALSADAATVAGSAALTSTGSFSATGSLSADAATLAGTATHLTLHTSTGALAADAATLAGTAAHLTLHTSTGGLSAGSATVSGVAVHSGPGAVEDTRPQGAGRPRRQVRRVVVEIDGKDFIVNNEEEAIALLDKAKEEAEALAKVQVQRAAKATVRKPRKVIADARKTLAVPTIKAPGLEEYVSKIMDDIRDTYASSMRTIEVAALLRKRDRDEEDDEEVLMLIA